MGLLDRRTCCCPALIRGKKSTLVSGIVFQLESPSHRHLGSFASCYHDGRTVGSSERQWRQKTVNLWVKRSSVKLTFSLYLEGLLEAADSRENTALHAAGSSGCSAEVNYTPMRVWKTKIGYPFTPGRGHQFHQTQRFWASPGSDPLFCGGRQHGKRGCPDSEQRITG